MKLLLILVDFKTTKFIVSYKADELIDDLKSLGADYVFNESEVGTEQFKSALEVCSRLSPHRNVLSFVFSTVYDFRILIPIYFLLPAKH
jgi:hypothetical protein